MEILWILGGILCVGCWYIQRASRLNQKKEAQSCSCENLLTEVESVIQDFLNYGRSVFLATEGKYRGIISFRLHTDSGTGELFFSVSMYDSGDLSLLSSEIINTYYLGSFVKKYGYFYDQERDAIVYQSTGRLSSQTGEERYVLQTMRSRIRKHPLAVLKSDTVICTRGI